MQLRSIRLQGLRNLEPIEVELAAGLNLVSGGNGAGKSSVLESILLLATGKSFRTSRLSNVVSWGQSGFVVGGQWCDAQGLTLRSGHRFQKESQLLLGGKPTSRLDLLQRFPTVFIGAESLKFFEDGPGFRRKQLDRGGFHVEPDYLSSWRRYQRALVQRNRLLKSPNTADGGQLRAWAVELDLAARHLGDARRYFVDRLKAAFAQYRNKCGAPDALTLEYRPGWDLDGTLVDQLDALVDKDRAAGFTGKGPHRDDLALVLNGRQALNGLSRGQQKAFMVAFFLALAEVIHQSSGRSPLLLLDDLPAELDTAHQCRILDTLIGARLQAVMTALDPDPSAFRPYQHSVTRFHVKHRTIYKCYN